MSLCRRSLQKQKTLDFVQNIRLEYVTQRLARIKVLSFFFYPEYCGGRAGNIEAFLLEFPLPAANGGAGSYNHTRQQQSRPQPSLLQCQESAFQLPKQKNAEIT